MPTQSTPQVCAAPETLDDLELMRRGVWQEATVGPDGPTSIDVPQAVRDAAAAAGAIEVIDPEGVPIARVAVSTGSGQPVVEGAPTWLGHRSSRSFERLYRSPAEVREEIEAQDALPVVIDRPVTTEDVAGLRDERGDRHVVLLVLAGGSPSAAVMLLRSAAAAANTLHNTEVVAVPLHPTAPADTTDTVLAAYAPTIPRRLTGEGRPLPEAAEATGTAYLRQGMVVLFTGLSGSGKSTLARALRDVLVERGERSVTLLDGDIVRRNLSQELTFSPEDREINVRRIGWVAAEIAHHGGTAICSPIAPFASTRQEVRQMAEDRDGAFVLVHVATPLEECERRDRKGLYAKARRGEVADFTGISSPYEEPDDADIRVDTTGSTISEALSGVLDLLRDRGLIAPATTMAPC